MVVEVYDIIVPADLDNYNDLLVVMEYLDYDLGKLGYKAKTLKDDQVVKIAYQLLAILKYFSSAKILLRNIQLQDILSNQDGNIRLCDFGLDNTLQKHFTIVKENDDNRGIQRGMMLSNRMGPYCAP